MRQTLGLIRKTPEQKTNLDLRALILTAPQKVHVAWRRYELNGMPSSGRSGGSVNSLLLQLPQHPIAHFIRWQFYMAAHQPRDNI